MRKSALAGSIVSHGVFGGFEGREFFPAMGIWQKFGTGS